MCLQSGEEASPVLLPQPSHASPPLSLSAPIAPTLLTHPTCGRLLSYLQGLSYDAATGHFYVIEEVVEQEDTKHLHPYAQVTAVHAHMFADTL